MTLASSLLSLHSVSKRFPGVLALDQIDLDLNAGEILALIGENGAGKSTLIKILAGIHPLDQGQITVDGRPVQIHTVRDAMELGISVIHQELNLAENLSIAENLFLGRQPSRGPAFLQITDRKTLHTQSAALLKRVGLNLSTQTRVEQLSIGQRQMVEIAKALSLNARIIIFDEPTSSLSSGETEKLFQLIKTLRKNGVAIIYISHRLAEVKELADRVVVLRDGQRVGQILKEQIEYHRMVTMMVGRDIKKFYHHQRREVGSRPLLEVKDLRYLAGKKPISFTIRRGEIVGFAGLVGAGRTELARAIFGVDPILSGQIRIKDQLQQIRNPRQAIKAGLMLVPEERKTQGLILEMNLSVNISLACLPRLARCGLLNRRAEKDLALRQKESLSIRANRLNQPVVNLSGGNQQKVVLAKWLAMTPTVLMLDEPTRGVDVGAKSEIYGLIAELTSRGIGIMVISSEMEEVIAISDRIIVMHEGKMMGQLTGQDITEENIMTLSTGQPLP